MAVSTALKAVITTTGRSGATRRETPRSCMPSAPGMRRSVTSASNASFWRRAPASPLLVRPTASYPTSASPSQIVSTSALSSSTTRIRGLFSRTSAMGARLEPGDPDGSSRPAAVLPRRDGQLPVVVGDDLAGDGEAEPRAASLRLGREEGLRRARGGGGADPHPVVRDQERHALA